MDARTWNNLIEALPGAHLLQTWEWGTCKAHYGWEPLPEVWRDEGGKVEAAALVLKRKLSLGGVGLPLTMLYAPRGPLLDWANAALRQRVLADLQSLARKERAVFIKIDPELALGVGVPGQAGAIEDPDGHAAVEEMTARGWRFSNGQVQFRNTVWLDLAGTEEDWLARMKQKARYNLRLAQRKGVTVRVGGLEDLDALYRLYAETSLRDGFVIRSEEYYLRVWQTFMREGMAEPLIAEVEGEAVAAIFWFHFAGRAWYLYGMSGQQHRERMPNYPLQWEAMRRARAAGCHTYDLWGAPDVFDETDPMWGVFRFKEGWGGTVVRTAGAWDFPNQPMFYSLIMQSMPRVMELLRRRGKARVRQEVTG